MENTGIIVQYYRDNQIFESALVKLFAIRFSIDVDSGHKQVVREQSGIN